ncbi:thiomuracin/GE37468 family thiazolyl RiPP peptide [Virgisporangium aurantiacum]|uniref:Uncharacterized protein n=1 Tax=Virgisporangium aurantiacum TaxID=175570 RepID=A0A8J3ZLR6_9ACTN|nr:thiomuracin/GE37468 family thiazolyl RiPP peptide [Virgisporangium aurantiacum]GIJ63831.1 hypothetical protein Vau01_113470 [Virgisporangium aurantiacum]
MEPNLQTLDLGLDVDDLDVDVFELVGGNLTTESLTAGHGMTELVASCDIIVCITSCPICSG